MNNDKAGGVLGGWSLTAIVVASMIGAGVYTTSGFALSDLGSPRWVLLAWIVGGVVALCGAISYGGLARRLTESGGEYLFLSRTLHPAAGFVAAWVSLLAGFTGALAFAATAFAEYALPAAWQSWMAGNVAASLLIVICAVLHLTTTRRGAFGQNLLIAVKLAMLILFLGFAVGALVAGRWSGGVDAAFESRRTISWFDFATTLTWISLSYSGFNAAIYVSGEARNPERNVPRAMWVGTGLVLLLYIALNAVFVLAPPPSSVAGSPQIAALAARYLGGDKLELLMRGVIALSLATSVSSLVMTGPRVYAKMAADNLFPPVFRLKNDNQPPRVSIIFQAMLGIVVVWATGLRELLNYLGLTLSISAAVTAAMLFVIYQRQGRAAVRGSGFPYAVTFYIGATALFATLTAMRQPAECLAAVLTFASGLAIYFLFARPHHTRLANQPSPPNIN